MCLATYLQFHIMRDYNHLRLSDKIGLRWKIGFPNNYHFLVSCFQDKIHLLGDIFLTMFVKSALSPHSGKYFFKNFGQSLDIFAEIMDVCDETHITRSCYAAPWEKH